MLLGQFGDFLINQYSLDIKYVNNDYERLKEMKFIGRNNEEEKG